MQGDLDPARAAGALIRFMEGNAVARQIAEQLFKNGCGQHAAGAKRPEQFRREGFRAFGVAQLKNEAHRPEGLENDERPRPGPDAA